MTSDGVTSHRGVSVDDGSRNLGEICKSGKREYIIDTSMPCYIGDWEIIEYANVYYCIS